MFILEICCSAFDILIRAPFGGQGGIALRYFFRNSTTLFTMFSFVNPKCSASAFAGPDMPNGSMVM